MLERLRLPGALPLLSALSFVFLGAVLLVLPEGGYLGRSTFGVALVGFGAILFFFFAWCCVTKLRQSLQADGESQSRLNALLDAAADGIITIDVKGRILSFNEAAARMFECPAEEVIGQPVTRLMPSPFRDEHDQYLQNYLETGVRKIIGIGREVVGMRADGSVFPLELAVNEVVLPDGVQFVALLRDISGRRALETQSARQEKLAAVGQLAAGVAHEIGNPLASISSVVQNLQRKNEDERVGNKLDLIGTHIDRIAHIVRQLVDFARPPLYEWREVCIPDVLTKVLEIVQFDPRAKNVKFEVELDPDLPAVKGMEDQLTQVFLNLLLNSLDALSTLDRQDQHLVSIGAVPAQHDQGLQIKVTVTDNGPGIPEEVSARVFEPFYTTKEVGKGTGLGLAVSFRIIEEHGGHLYLETLYRGGSCFVIELPAAQAEL